MIDVKEVASVLHRIQQQGALAAVKFPEGIGLDAEVCDAIKKVVAASLMKFGARHADDCPGSRQVYWRMRPEYRTRGWGPDRPCTCGLTEIIGLENEARLRP